MFRPLFLLGCAAALCACAANDTAVSALDSGRPVSALAAAAPSPADYVAQAGAADLFEIESSRLAMQRATNSTVRGYAQMMIDHHTASTNRIQAAARASGLSPRPAMLPADKQRVIADLANVAGQAFDQAYIDAQLAAHAEALNLHRAFVGGGDAKPLQDAAAAIIPVVEQHIQHARTLSNRDGSGRREQ